MKKEDAIALATAHLGEIAQSSQVPDLVILDEHSFEHSAGFVFFYNSRKYFESRDASDALAGNGPMLVLRSGEVVILPTYQPIEDSLAEYEQR